MKKSDINVLIVDDDKSIREALSEAVKRRGYKVVAVGKPDEAESIVKIKPIHGVIVDVMLPGKNGVDLVKKLRENLMDGVGIIYISGIYRDRAFAQEAIKSTDAIEYFIKPFNTDEMLDLLEKSLNQYIEAPKVDLHALLASPYASNRERRKALDHVEEMCGYDLPFVLCILMDSESSGHLNIVDADHNIFGITLAKGTLARVDSESTALLTKKILIQHGFITELELSELKSKKSGGDLVKSLVDEGLMSPHASSLIKTETIISELKKLINNSNLKINFVLDRKVQSEPDNIDWQTFTEHLHEMIENYIKPEWLKNFYSTWLGYPIKLGPQFSEYSQLAMMPLLRRLDKFADLCKNETTIEDLIVNYGPAHETHVYKALHFLMLKRLIVFEEIKRVKNIDDHVQRLKIMHNEIVNKNPVQIFQYFGLSDNPKAADVVRIYKEFAKSHHPDTLPKAAGADIKDLNHDLFARVTSAYEILSNEDKRNRYFNEIKQKEAEAQFKSDELVTAAALALNRGKYAEALPVLQEAVQYYESERSLLHYWWAKFKVEGNMKAEEIPQIEKKMRAMSQGMRKTALWIFVNGLVKKFNGDKEGAATDFNRALSVEENFMDARRELALVKTLADQKTKNEDLLTGDITAVVKNLFKKKKGA